MYSSPDTFTPEVGGCLSHYDRGNFEERAKILDSNKVWIKVFGQKEL